MDLPYRIKDIQTDTDLRPSMTQIQKCSSIETNLYRKPSAYVCAYKKRCEWTTTL